MPGRITLSDIAPPQQQLGAKAFQPAGVSYQLEQNATRYYSVAMQRFLFLPNLRRRSGWLLKLPPSATPVCAYLLLGNT